MEARAELRPRMRLPQLRLARADRTKAGLASTGIVAGILGGLVAGATVVLWDWAHSAHSALELPMAVSAWLFGLEHFEPNGYVWWAIVVGALFLIGFWALLGLAFAWLAERAYEIRRLGGALAGGAAWSFLTFVFTWYMLLPVARDGAPIQQTVAQTGQVAPMWIWILSYVALGISTGLAYWALALRRRPREQ